MLTNNNRYKIRMNDGCMEISLSYRTRKLISVLECLHPQRMHLIRVRNVCWIGVLGDSSLSRLLPLSSYHLPRHLNNVRSWGSLAVEPLQHPLGFRKKGGRERSKSNYYNLYHYKPLNNQYKIRNRRCVFLLVCLCSLPLSFLALRAPAWNRSYFSNVNEHPYQWITYKVNRYGNQNCHDWQSCYISR